MTKRPPANQMSRRYFLRRAGVVGGAAAVFGVGVAIAETLNGGRPTAARGTDTSTTVARHPRSHRPAAVHRGLYGLPVADWVVAENARPGTTGWLATGSPPHGLEGFTDRTSYEAGDTVRLFVNTTARSFTVEAYRMGYYQGKGARLVASFGPVRGEVQPPATFTSGINMVECHWHESTRLTVGDDWPQGYYLLRLVAPNGWSEWVPMLVRDDASKAAILVQSSVTTWQAYNLWGGYSLYGTGPGGYGYDDRSRVVSFDRPYPAYDEYGSADFIGNEFPLMALLERHGVDVAYWTDLDLHRRPELLANHRCLVSLGHDEYYSAEMRYGAQAAVDRGLNLAVLGANASYRHIRLDASPIGPDRRQVCYKDGTEDPLYGVDNAAVTSNWEDPPVPRPECQLLGVEYQAYGAYGDLVVADASSFVFEGTGLHNGDHIPGVLGSEFDAYVPESPSPANLQILCHSPAPSVLGPMTSDMGYYTTAAGGGVFATGTASWVNRLWDNRGELPVPFAPVATQATAAVSRATLNVLAAFSHGPASANEPSKANWQDFYRSGEGALATASLPGH